MSSTASAVSSSHPGSGDPTPASTWLALGGCQITDQVVVLPESVVEVLRYRAAPPRPRNTDGDKTGLKRLPRTLTRLDAASEARAKAWLDED